MEQRDQGDGAGKFSTCRCSQSIWIRTSELVKRLSEVCHPGSTFYD